MSNLFLKSLSLSLSLSLSQNALTMSAPPPTTTRLIQSPNEIIQIRPLSLSEDHECVCGTYMAAHTSLCPQCMQTRKNHQAYLPNGVEQWELETNNEDTAWEDEKEKGETATKGKETNVCKASPTTPYNTTIVAPSPVQTTVLGRAVNPLAAYRCVCAAFVGRTQMECARCARSRGKRMEFVRRREGEGGYKGKKDMEDMEDEEWEDVEDTGEE
ncbi:hypothetical protein T440DRAFT_552197 [Plenodomus tracheiphilus IPT5]|uniref:Uncharacterized protein n=1 Tax=Plenodomus tracheiphilus IPT5 TaxID=1408161 RepID=A0A6A7BJP3_9PLEO|nr:hypothetical protein T440DRAFT_552197 [Plenodomus tracheiphilus IPT5]